MARMDIAGLFSLGLIFDDTEIVLANVRPHNVLIGSVKDEKIEPYLSDDIQTFVWHDSKVISIALKQPPEGKENGA